MINVVPSENSFIDIDPIIPKYKRGYKNAQLAEEITNYLLLNPDTNNKEIAADKGWNIHTIRKYRRLLGQTGKVGRETKMKKCFDYFELNKNAIEFNIRNRSFAEYYRSSPLKDIINYDNCYQYYNAWKKGYKPGPRGKESSYDYDIMKLWNEGYSTDAIAEKLKISVKNVQMVTRKYDVTNQAASKALLAAVEDAFEASEVYIRQNKKKEPGTILEPYSVLWEYEIKKICYG